MCLRVPAERSLGLARGFGLTDADEVEDESAAPPPPVRPQRDGRKPRTGMATPRPPLSELALSTVSGLVPSPLPEVIGNSSVLMESDIAPAVPFPELERQVRLITCERLCV